MERRKTGAKRDGSKTKESEKEDEEEAEEGEEGQYEEDEEEEEKKLNLEGMERNIINAERGKMWNKSLFILQFAKFQKTSTTVRFACSPICCAAPLHN